MKKFDFWIEVKINPKHKKRIEKLNSDNIKKIQKESIKRITFFLEWESSKNTPVDTWLLRASQRTVLKNWWLTWFIKNSRVYWIYVHKKNPWMTNTVNENKNNITKMYNKTIEDFLKNFNK